jgi:hypothetical protein
MRAEVMLSDQCASKFVELLPSLLSTRSCRWGMCGAQTHAPDCQRSLHRQILQGLLPPLCE